ncbi:unnamed protein product [Calypogeia fissa]
MPTASPYKGAGYSRRVWDRKLKGWRIFHSCKCVAPPLWDSTECSTAKSSADIVGWDSGLVSAWEPDCWPSQVPQKKRQFPAYVGIYSFRV